MIKKLIWFVISLVIYTLLAAGILVMLALAARYVPPV